MVWGVSLHANWPSHPSKANPSLAFTSTGTASI